MNKLDKETKEKLVRLALDARKFSYSPYSNYKVGAALLTTDGTIFTGCNVENASYPCGTCAERTALLKAVSEGFQKFTAIAVCGSSEEICTPCGLCRQALYEFAPDLLVLCCSSNGNYEEHTLRELLLNGFGHESME